MTLGYNLIDIENRRIYPAEIQLENGKIKSIQESDKSFNEYILPGFIDSHIHIESSMLAPSEFARIAVKHGTVATVSDPHEIANVCGMPGIEFMIDNGKKVPFNFFYGAPSCVPATAFEGAGAKISSEDIRTLLEREEILYLSEMMNWPGVLSKDKEVMKKIAIAKELKKPIDGHAPGLKGEQAKAYASVGISSDHECFTKQEALDKLKCGMKILIREGSAAKNFEALIELLHDYEDEIMFCSDDKHPDELLVNHINQHVKRALAKGIDLFKVLKAACINPILHYNLPVGRLRIGDNADFIIVDSPASLNLKSTWIKGEEVYSKGHCNFDRPKITPINNFNCKSIVPESLAFKSDAKNIRVIEAHDEQLITSTAILPALIKEGNIVANMAEDILKIVVINRYEAKKAAIGFIKNFGLQKGAIASTVAHDSHNIICVGCDDKSMSEAINKLIATEGGISIYDGTKLHSMPLPIAGLMSTESAEVVGEAYSSLDKLAKSLGSRLSAPFMTLSFMALLVIPELKLSDEGLFDGRNFAFSTVEVE